MYTIDANVLRNLGNSHAVSGRLLASVNRSAFTYPVKMLEGEVSVDGNSPIRRKLSAKIVAKLSDPECDVFRTEIRAEYGISLNNFSWVWIPVGTFVVVKATEDNGVVTISGEDRWRRVANARFLRPVTTSGLHVNAIKSLVEGADGRITCIDYTAKTSTHRSSIWERDRDKAALDLAKAIGVDVYFNPTGGAETRLVPTIDATKAWNVGGGDGGVFIGARKGTSQDRTYNAVVVEGEDASGNVAVRAVSTITNGASSLLFGGSFSQKPRYFRSSLITSQAQAQSTADSMLLRVSGVAKEIEIDSFVNPALEAGDTVKAEMAAGVWEYHLVESFTIPLGPGGMTLNTKTSEVEGD